MTFTTAARPATALKPVALRLGTSASRRHGVRRVACAAVMEVDLKVEGMVCDKCTSSVKSALEGVKEVESVTDISLQTGIANVNVDAPTQYDMVDMLPSLIDAVSSVGFRAEPYFGGQPQPLDTDTTVDP